MSLLADISDIAGLVSFVLLVGGYLLYYYENHYKAYRNYRNRLFRDHVNFSLNYIAHGKALKMRTLEESKAENIFTSTVLIDKINKACNNTTSEDPVLTMKDQADQEYMLRSALNYLSSRFGSGFLAQAFGDKEGSQPQEKEFVIAVTYEVPVQQRDPPIASKVRVMVISEDDLITHFAPEAEPTVDKFQLESRWHANRILTLRQIGERYVDEKQRWKAGETFVPSIYTMKLALP